MIAALAYLVLTCLVAAVPFGLVVTTLYGGGPDLRVSGSGNIGATNVARVFGWHLAGPVVVLDVSKGLLPVLLARLLWPEAGLVWLATVAGTAFVGHCWPVYLEFRGGKGVATGAGALLGTTPLPSLVAAATWLVLLGATGRSSVAALTATVVAMLAAAVLDPVALPVVGLLAIGVVGRHVANIRRLVRGEETEVMRPVRWGRSRGGAPTDPEALLHQGPAGSAAAPPLWKEEEESTSTGATPPSDPAQHPTA